MSNLMDLEKKVDLLVDIITCPEYDSVRRERLLVDLMNLKCEVSERSRKSAKVISEDFLTELGIPTSVSGYKFLVTAICSIVKEPELGWGSCMLLYSKVSDIHNSSPKAVERAIRHAIEMCFDRIDYDALCKYFGNSVSFEKGKATNVEFMFRIAQLVQREMEE